MNKFFIGDREIGDGLPPFVIAELSANHNGDLKRALDIVDAAADAGASALKLQTYTADSLTIDCDKPDFQITDGPWAGRSMYELYQQASTPWQWHEQLFKRAQSRGLEVFSSPFDKGAVDFLLDLGVPAFKIASFELVDIPLIEYVAATGKPMIMSTGMASLQEIEAAIAAARKAGCESLGVLYCISGYPTPVEQANIRTISDLKQRFGIEIGLSDHTPGFGVAPAAVALGATIFEKHLTMNRAAGGPDAAFSLEPEEFSSLVQSVNQASVALGSVQYANKDAEKGNQRFRRSLYVVQDIHKGGVLTEDNIRSIRPSFGLAPKHYPEVIGRGASRDLERGEALAWDMID